MKNEFETHINRLITAINKSKKGFGWQNYPNRLHKGQYIKGEPFDFIIISKNYSCCFDAKMTKLDHYKIEKKDIAQAHNLLQVWKTGIDAFFLIYFLNNKDYGRLNILNFYKILEDRKYIQFSDCDNFRLERKFA